MSNVRIVVRDVGNHFAKCAAVLSGNNRTLHTTADYPFEKNAIQAALTWACAHDHTVTAVTAPREGVRA